MTTDTTLSAASLTCPEAGRGFPEPRRVDPRKPVGTCRCAAPATGLVASSNFQTRVSGLQILIANARLEFNVSHSKETLLQISNRERIAISYVDFRGGSRRLGFITLAQASSSIAACRRTYANESQKSRRDAGGTKCEKLTTMAALVVATNSSRARIIML
jgi:hypothetical protein